jgi:hypothetical protein
MGIQVKRGTITGTGAAINTPLGFVAGRVVLQNRNTSIAMEWTDAMPAASGHKTLAAGTKSYVTTGGISAYAGAAGVTGAGFTLGTDSINVAGNVIDYVAYSQE